MKSNDLDFKNHNGTKKELPRLFEAVQPSTMKKSFLKPYYTYQTEWSKYCLRISEKNY